MFAPLLATLLSNSSDIEIAISIPKYSMAYEPTDRPRVLHRTEGVNYFSVVIRNVSSKTLELFADGNSWGDYTLEFELRGSGGKPLNVHRRLHGYSRNAPVTVRLEAGEVWVRNVYYDPPTAGWEGFPELKPGESADCNLTAVLTQTTEPNSPDKLLWSGTTRSKPIEVIFRKM